ncbi:MAG: chromosome segregation protein SMC [Verrucomicrobiaceae bacterium]|nr:MAG: chromosome segregation protein SMC [Verrucomicrobiaceae bacterium]
MNSSQLTRIRLEGYKSIRQCDLELRELNVLIGPNGAGKSNFIGFFKLLQQMLEENLQYFVSKNGGPDAFLHFGRKKTEQLKAELYFGNNGYKFVLEPTKNNRFIFVGESLWWNVRGDYPVGRPGNLETGVHKHKNSTVIYNYVVPTMHSWRVYHFHDTSETALVKQLQPLNDNAYFRHDARNLAPFLRFLENNHPEAYKRIVKTVQLVAPFFGDFHLRKNPDNPELTELEWTEKGEDTPFKAHHLSDGTLRFICLATVFLQPEDLQPQTIIVDEPELGLHPYAINILGTMIRSASKSRQVVISTQSVTLLNEFGPDDVIVADRKDGSSSLRRVEGAELKEWLKEYSLGELWEKNILGGRPAR